MSGNDVIPARLQASDFTFVNATPERVTQFEQMLNYVQDHSRAGTAILQAFWLTGARVGLNPFQDSAFTNIGGRDWTGKDVYLAEEHIMLWNPNSALQIFDGQGNVIGVQSATIGAIHEMTHGIDPQLMANLLEKVPQYKNLAEYVAVQYENMVASDLGEVQRVGYNGNLYVYADNSTTHTGYDPNGNLVWMRVNEFGQVEYGPKYYHDKIDTIHDSPGSAPPFPGDPNSNPPDSPPDTGKPENGPPPPTDPRPNGNTDSEGGNGGGNPPPPYHEDPYDGSYDDPNHGKTDPPPGSGNTDANGGYGGGYGGGGGGGGGACVAIESFLPDGRRAGTIKVGDTMQLGDQETMEAGTGQVSYSQQKEARGYRIITESGASLICSDTAPIPAKGKGLLTPDKLLGERVAVRWDEGGKVHTGWELVTAVDEVGVIQVQHITVGDKCFWAGEKKGAYILHHNLKDGGGGGVLGDWPDDWDDPLKAHTDKGEHQTTSHGSQGSDSAQLVGVAPPPLVDGLTLL